MPQPDFVRIASNVAALNALNALNIVNRNLAIAQTRLATGRRINEAADDPALLTVPVGERSHPFSNSIAPSRASTWNRTEILTFRFTSAGSG